MCEIKEHGHYIYSVVRLYPFKVHFLKKSSLYNWNFREYAYITIGIPLIKLKLLIRLCIA